MPSSRSYVPDYIQFYPTLRCNLSCSFCFNKSVPFCDDITLEDFKKLSGKLIQLNIKTIDIIGGEPALHKNIIQIIEYAHNKGILLNISSNGTDTEMLAEIISTYKNITAGVSVNDMAEFERLKDFIKLYRPVAKTVFLNNLNTALLNHIISADPSKFYLLYPDAITNKDLLNTIRFPDFLAASKQFDSPLIETVYCSGFIPDSENYPQLAKTRCAAGTTKLGVMPDGSVYPCNLFFGIREFRLGNLLYDRFETIWEHELLDFFRTSSNNTCPIHNCNIHDKCHGGCPAHSLIHSCNLGSPEPRCISK